MAHLAQAVIWIGYLTRWAYDAGEPECGVDGEAFLSSLDPWDSHPSVRRAKLTAMAVLGNWIPLLSALRQDDPVLRGAARNRRAVRGLGRPVQGQGIRANSADR